MKNFDEMLPTDREFTVGGETFHWRNVRPEVLSAFASDAEDDDPNAGWKMIDGRILQFLEPAEHDRWRELRGREDNPVTIGQLQSVVTWLLETQSARPTSPPSPSASGRGKTADTSKAA